MEVPLEAIRQRFGADSVEVADFHQGARIQGPDYTLEVSFAGKYRMFGALIDLQWVGLRGMVLPEDDQYEYRFDKKRFAVKKGSDDALALRLADTRTIELAGRSELKSLSLTHGPAGRRVIITPLPGTITAVYFPPLPPYSVPLKPHEAKDHIALALHLLEV